MPAIVAFCYDRPVKAVSAVLALLLCLAALPAAAQVPAQTLTLDPSTGSLRVFLYKDGPLAALGHDHVLSAPEFSGQIEYSSGSAQLMLTIDALQLIIDTTPVREAEGLVPLKDSDVAKIAAGMRSAKGLDVVRYPKITFRSDSIDPVAGEKDLWEVMGRFSLHGATQTIDFPVTMTDGPGGKWFTGYVRLRPSEYGVKPYSVFGGAIRLKDEAVVRFTLLGVVR